jgi:hypothetical protein
MVDFFAQVSFFVLEAARLQRSPVHLCRKRKERQWRKGRTSLQTVAWKRVDGRLQNAKKSGVEVKHNRLLNKNASPLEVQIV